MSSKAFTPATLPNGTVLKNRIVKAAMEENLANVTAHNGPSPELLKLYETWGQGGAGLILSGHIMLDPLCMAAAGDILLSEEVPLDEPLWRDWISRTQASGAKFYFQLNHPGRQVRKGAGMPAYAPSAIRVDIGKLASGAFETPVALTEEQILKIISRFAYAAKKCEQLGASGVQIHSAHGYLSSQFLSPRTNVRTDRWGGSIENRSRFLLETVKAVRAQVSPAFGVAVKINSSDFQKGGFDATDLKHVVAQLNALGGSGGGGGDDEESSAKGNGIDFLELSGGSYEIPAMMGASVPDLEHKKAASTKAREAYFLSTAESLDDLATMPLLVTGGISRLATLHAVMDSTAKVRLAGVGTAMGLLPDLPQRWERGEDPAPRLTANTWFLPGFVVPVARIAGVQWALHQLGRGKEAWPGVWPSWALGAMQVGESRNMGQYLKWVEELGLRKGEAVKA
jgi:2,4-dienoyl-CoA reductase-like NADH-dependent reductase (Old Yellow Enzyme family)